MVATDENIAHFSFAQFPVLRPARNDAASFPPPPKDLLSDDQCCTSPHPFQSYPVPKAEALQPVDEVGTRRFHSTMNKKAPKPNSSKKGPNQKASGSYSLGGLELPSPSCTPRPSPTIATSAVDPTAEFVAAVNNSFHELVQRLRGFQGEVTVEAEFGRILMKRIPRKGIALGDSEASLDSATALGLLENAIGVQPIAVFTKILTVLPADISYLVEMRDRQGQAIWDKNQCGWSVSYEMLCVDSRSGRLQPFTIEIDGEKLEARAKTRRGLGEINVHGIKRHWDFRISATGIETTENVDAAHTEFAEVVKKTLHIP